MNIDEQEAFDKIQRSREKLGAEAKQLRTIIQNLKVKKKELEERLEHQRVMLNGYCHLIRNITKELP